MHNLTKETLMTAYWFKGRENNFLYFENIAKRVKQPALVFVPGGHYVFVSFTNPPTLGNRLIFAVNQEDRNLLLMRLYPGYQYYKVEYNKVSQKLVPLNIWGRSQ